MRPLLSVIVPSLARESLLVTLRSLADQPEADLIEVIVVFDTHGPQPAHIARLLAAMTPTMLRPSWTSHSVRLFVHDAEHHCSGNCQRNYGLLQARGQWVAFLDDDDVWLPGALATIVANQAEIPVIYRMRYAANGRVLWKQPDLICGNVGSPMFVIPNETTRLGHWSQRYEGDFDFLAETVDRYDGRVVWRSEIIAEIRPGG